MIDIINFYKVLVSEGIEFITGVPDTNLNDFCLSLDTYWNDKHAIAAMKVMLLH